MKFLRKILNRPKQDKQARASSPLSPTGKAAADDFLGRFREIVSDPLNLLIERDPRSGTVEDGAVWLHNGNRVPADCYYGRFSEILAINRGVHEPLEEFIFQQVMRLMPADPTMLELGAYWAHYSMWMKRKRSTAKVFMVESDPVNLQVGRANFALNSFEGAFISAKVGHADFQVDQFMSSQGHPQLAILHSDIQGFESEMLDGCAETFSRGLIDYAFVSTHSQTLHAEVIDKLTNSGMRVEVSADFENETTSYDGLVFSSRSSLPPVFSEFAPMGRREINKSSSEKLISYISAASVANNAIANFKIKVPTAAIRLQPHTKVTSRAGR